MGVKSRLIIKVIYTCLLLSYPFPIKAVMILTDNFNDLKAIEEAYAPNMDSVVLIITENKRGQRVGTGVVVNLPDRVDLNGRLILTAAHVIENGVMFVIPNAKGSSLSGIQPQKITTLKSPGFDYDKSNETRNDDFGIILLETPLAVSAKELPTNRVLTNDDLLTLVGYGAHFTLSTKTQLPFDGTKRLFHNKITKIPQNPSYRLFSSNIIENRFSQSLVENYAAPFSGDSGGPVFASGNFSIVRGIMSGMGEMPHVHYVNVTQQDVKSLLSLLENKREKVSKAILTALDKEDVELFMQAIGLLNSSISENKNIKWGSIFYVLAKPSYQKKFLSMFQSKEEALGHWKNFIISSMQNKNLEIDDKIGFVKVLSLFDTHAALIAASSIVISNQGEKHKIEDLVFKIQQHKALDFHEQEKLSLSKPSISPTISTIESGSENRIFHKISQDILTALDKEDVELFMQAVGLLNSSISENKNIKWGSIFYVLAKPSYQKKFLSMFHTKEEALGHWKNFIISSMQNKNLEIDDKISFVKVLSLFDTHAALRAASDILISTQGEKHKIEDLVSKIQRGENLEF